VTLLQQERIFVSFAGSPPLTRSLVQGSVDDMDKLAPWPKRVVRSLIASLLAWAVVMQGEAAAARIGGGALDAAVVAAHVDRCAAAGGDHRDSSGRHASCFCCVPCRSDRLDSLAAVASASPRSVETSPPVAELDRAERLTVLDAASPLGWISSWSQRAPPRAVSTSSPLEAFET
jgi:hypothetical protein